MAKRFTIVLDDEIYQELAKQAKRDRRSVSNMAALIIAQSQALQAAAH